MSVELKKPHQDIYEAMSMVSNVTTRIRTIRQAIDTNFPSWYSEIMNDVVATETILRTPSTSPTEYYKIAIAITLLDTLILQLNDRLTTENNQHLYLLHSVIPSVFPKVIEN